jgi:hypothetical protein
VAGCIDWLREARTAVAMEEFAVFFKSKKLDNK